MKPQERKEIASRLHSACLHVLRAVRTVDADSGLSAARLSALSVLVFGGPRTIGELAAAEGVRSPTMTALVNHLEADGLVTRRSAPSGGDRRRVVVAATRAGTAQMKAAQGRRVDRLVELLTSLDDGDLALLSDAAAAMERTLRP